MPIPSPGPAAAPAPVRPSLGPLLAERARGAFRDSLAAAVAALLAWLIAHFLFGHPRPLFAAVTAIACLAPGLPNHGRQSVGVLLGVFTGICVGEVVLLAPEQAILFQLPVAAFVAMMIASLYGQPAVVPINAGISALLVVALGPSYAGYARLLDVCVGSAVGLLFSQVLLTPDPVAQIDSAVRKLLGELGAGFSISADALAERNEARALAAVKRVSAAHEAVIALDAAIATARSTARWSIRGQLAAREVAAVAARYDRRAIRLYASALLLTESIASALRRGEAPQPGRAEGLAALAAACAAINAGEEVERPLPEAIPAPPGSPWVATDQYFDDVVTALDAFRRSGDGADGPDATGRPTDPTGPDADRPPGLPPTGGESAAAARPGR